MKTIAKSRLNELLKALDKEYNILVPFKEESVSKFVPWQEGVDPYFEENTLLPPKDILFPQTEKMYGFKVKDKSVEIEELTQEKGQQIIFGLRSCDAYSIDCLDKVFLTKGYEDGFYRQKRENTLLWALACTKPQDSCFCESIGIDPREAVCADVQIYDLGEEWGFTARSAAGEELLQKLEGLFTDKDAEPLPVQGFSITVDMEGVPEKLANMFDHPLWEEVSRKCLGCAACTYLCPTCHCFDIAGSVKGGQGYKFRCWDSCMFSEYTRMAGGHNPRPSKKERVRNRFLHKLYYFVERYGQLLCTGCGRCLAKCPVNMDITAIIRKIKEAQQQ